MSDLHLGKAGHFRKAGIAIPQSVFKEDLQRLFSLIQYFGPLQLLIVGDFFHSYANKEMGLFLKWRNDLAHLKIQLIPGNHDILTKKFYADAGILVTDDTLSLEDFCFTHDIGKSCGTGSTSKDIFTFSGHLHPGVGINGAGRQQLYFPCFYFTKKYAVLPAFSYFTGLAKVKPTPADHVFIIAGGKILDMRKEAS